MLTCRSLNVIGIKNVSNIRTIRTLSEQKIGIKAMKATKSHQQPIHLVTGSKDVLTRPQVRGKFFYVGDEKLWIRGVTYGTFRPDESGNEFSQS